MAGCINFTNSGVVPNNYNNQIKIKIQGLSGFGRFFLARNRRLDQRSPTASHSQFHIDFAPSSRHDEVVSDTFSNLTVAGADSAGEIDAGAALASVAFTDAAARKVQELVLEEGNPGLMLRVYISGGGCSGFQYGFTFDESRAEDDIAVENEGVTLLIDPLSYQYLMGAEVDYSETLQGAQFVIRNPNATTTCGCGSSFSV